MTDEDRRIAEQVARESGLALDRVLRIFEGIDAYTIDYSSLLDEIEQLMGETGKSFETCSDVVRDLTYVGFRELPWDYPDQHPLIKALRECFEDTAAMTGESFDTVLEVWTLKCMEEERIWKQKKSME